MTEDEADEARTFFAEKITFITTGTWEEPGNVHMLYRLAQLGLITVQRVMYAEIGQSYTGRAKFGVQVKLTPVGIAYRRMLGDGILL